MRLSVHNVAFKRSGKCSQALAVRAQQSSHSLSAVRVPNAHKSVLLGGAMRRCHQKRDSNATLPSQPLKLYRDTLLSIERPSQIQAESAQGHEAQLDGCAAKRGLVLARVKQSRDHVFLDEIP